jgi:hypothetical protein
MPRIKKGPEPAELPDGFCSLGRPDFLIRMGFWLD